MRLVAILVVGYVTLCSSVLAEQKPDYFPLQVGNRWVYTLQLADKETWYGIDTAVVEIAATGTEKQANGQEYYRFETTLLNRSLPEWFPEAFFASIELSRVAFYRSDSAGHIFRYIKEWEYRGVQAEELSYDFTFEKSRTWTGVRFGEITGHRGAYTPDFPMVNVETNTSTCFLFSYFAGCPGGAEVCLDDWAIRSDLLAPGIGVVQIVFGAEYNYIGTLSLREVEIDGVHYPLPTGVRSSEWGRVKSLHK